MSLKSEAASFARGSEQVSVVTIVSMAYFPAKFPAIVSLRRAFSSIRDLWDYFQSPSEDCVSTGNLTCYCYPMSEREFEV
jgi:hypothetical protein